MRLQQEAEARPHRTPTAQLEASEKARKVAEQLARRLHQRVRVIVNVNEDMSCSRIRSFLGG